MLFKPLLVIVLSVSGVLSQWGWRVTYTPERICALNGSSVDMSCSYSYPTSHTVQKTFWFIHWNKSQEPNDLSQDSEYSDRAEYLGNNNSDCTFRIKQLRERDSAVYRFRFLTDRQDGKYTGQPGVSLTVTGLQVKVTENEAQRVTLTCSSTCTLSGTPTITWNKNGKVVSNKNKKSINLASTDDSDLYSCATGGVTSPAVNVKCVKVEINSDTVSGGETVELTCRATCTWLGNSFFWYKNEQRLTDYYRFSQANIKFTAKSEDTGRYSCAVNDDQRLVSPAVTLSVRCVTVEMKSNTVSEGVRVTLTCKITCTDLTGSQTFIWYKNGQYLSHTTQKYQNHDLQFIASIGDAGSYSCAVNGHDNLPSPAVTLYPPKNTSVSVPPPGEIVEGKSVTLTCSSDANPPVQKYTWYKNNKPVSSETGGPEDSYTINTITQQDAVEYYCEAENVIGTGRSPPIRLDVKYPPKSVSVSVSSSGEIVEGSSVTLTCSSSDANPPVHIYAWYKYNRAELPWVGSSYTITSITLQDAGQYYCEAGNGIGTKTRSPPIRLDVKCVLSQRGWGVTYTPERICALKGSSVDMRCSYSYPPPHTVQKTFWFIHWNKPQEPEDLSQDPEYSPRVKYLGNKNKNCTFRINKLSVTDTNTYRFRFLTECDKYTGEPGVALKVTALQVKVNPDTVTEGQSVRLTCSTTCTLTGSPAFIWYRDGSPLSFTGRSHQFTASSEDRSRYFCVVKGYELQSPAVALNVRYPPKSVSVSVSPSGEIVEGSSVTLTCSSDANPPVQRHTWYKNNRAELSWRGSSYTIESITQQDAGEYYCEAGNGIGKKASPPKHLDVQYPPKSVSVSMSPSGEIVEGSSVTLTCSSDANPPVQRYTWYKNNRAVSSETGGPEDRYTIKTITLQDAVEYICVAQNGIGKETRSPPIRLDVKYPPKSVSVSVSPSGEIVEGSSVTLTCSSSHANPPVQRYTWYTKYRAVFSETGGPEDSYTFKSITLQDAGEYYCEAKNAIGTNRSLHKSLDVQYPPKSVSVSVSPSGEIVEGSSVTLTCSSDANPPVQRHTWYKKNDTGFWLAGSGQSLNFSNFRSWNSGQYYCEAQNRLGALNSTALLVTVQGGQSLIVAAAVGVPAILALVFLGVVCVRRRKSINETEGDRQGNKSPIYGNVSGMAMSHTGTQDTDTDDGEVPLYSSVQPANTRNQEQVLYSTVQKSIPQCEEGVQYASIQFRPSSAAPRSPAASVKEDCVLYSTLRKLDM